MNQYNALAAPFIAGFGLVLAGLGFWTFMQEGGTYLINAPTALTTINLRSDSDPVGLGITTRRDVLEECEVTLRSAGSFELMLQPAIEFEQLRARCADLAQEIAADAPTFSLAWTIAAQAAAEAGDWDQMSQFLVSSQRSGPNEQWIGRFRFEIADANFEHLNEDSREVYNQDLRMLILSNKGIPYIARQYVLDSSFRVRLTDVLETMSVADQQRYVSALRRMVPR